MLQITTATLSFLLVLNAANALITPDEAKDLALQQSQLLGAKRHFDSEMNGEPFERFLDTYQNSAGQGTISRVRTKFGKIVDSLRANKQYYQNFITFVEPLEHIKNHLQFEYIDSEAQQIYNIANNERKGPVDVFNVLAHNQDPQSKCVTNASSVDLITKLYEAVAYAQVGGLTVQLYTLNLLTSVTTSSSENEAEELVKRLTDNLSVTFSKANAAIKTAKKNMKKCNSN